MKRRDRIYKKYIKAKNSDIKNEYEKQYKSLRNQIVTLCRVNKRLHFQNYFLSHANNMKNTWKGINQIININSKGKKIPDQYTVASSFNKYFSTIAEKIQAKVYHLGTDFSEYLNDMNEYNCFIEPTNPVEIINTINKLDCNKATGPYSIPNEILHLIKMNIADPISILTNLSFAKAFYFGNMKIAKVIPVYKYKGNILDTSNYRPISLLSNINKIIEKLMYERLYSFLTLHNVIYINQNGFRKIHSTIHALISLHHVIYINQNGFRKNHSTIHALITLHNVIYINHNGFRKIHSTIHDLITLHNVIYINQNGFRKNHSTIHALITLHNVIYINHNGFRKIHSTIHDLITLHNVIYINQNGFRKNHSTIHDLISLTDDIRNALDNNNVACGIFIDLKKAFDTVDHEILLKKLSHYGIRGLANDWFKSYLNNRQQFVSMSGYDSDKLIIKHGVPQGSVLGPLLFLVYINDLHKSIKYCTVRHFADDTNLLISSNSPKQLQSHLNSDLKCLCKWLRANKICLNISKIRAFDFQTSK